MAEKTSLLPQTDLDSTLNDRIFNELYHKLIEVEIPPGTPLNFSQLSAEIGVSRTPIRNAVASLERMGLVVRGKDRIYRAAPISLEEYREICDFREAIEGEAAFLAATSIRGSELQQLKELLGKMERLKSVRKATHPVEDDEFHALIIHASRNSYLKEAFELCRYKCGRYRWFLHFYGDSTEDGGRTWYNLHMAIYNALSLHIPEMARMAVRQDVESMRATVPLLGYISVQQKCNPEDKITE